MKTWRTNLLQIVPSWPKIINLQSNLLCQQQTTLQIYVKLQWTFCKGNTSCINFLWHLSAFIKTAIQLLLFTYRECYCIFYFAICFDANCFAIGIAWNITHSLIKSVVDIWLVLFIQTRLFLNSFIVKQWNDSIMFNCKLRYCTFFAGGTLRHEKSLNVP